MKRIHKLSAVLIAAAVIASVSVFPANAANKKPSAYIKASAVNIRSGAGTNHSVIANLAKKTNVTLLSGKLYNGSWYYIKLKNGKKGYVSKSYLKVNKNQLYIGSTATGYAGYTKKITNVVNTTGKKIKWTSSNKKVAKVNQSGKITCLKKGKSTIKLTAGGKKCTFKLTVKKAAVTLDKTSAVMFTDDTLTLKATCPKSVTFKSSDNSVATVSKSGVITAKAVGKAIITAKSKSGSASCNVTVNERVITLTADRTTIFTGGAAQLSASGGKYAYTYKSSDESVLTVDKNGIAKGVSAGKANVTCTSGELTATKAFTVKKGDVINLSSTEGSVKKGMTLYVKSTTKGVSWRSSDESVATVDGGFVCGVKKGTAIITAYTSGGEKSCIVTVEAAEPVRFVYTSENSALLGDSVTFYAITDTSRTNVKFKLTDANGVISWLENPTKTKNDGRYVWSASKSLGTAGVYTVIAYAQTKSNTEWKTSNGGSATTFVNSSDSRTAVSTGERRVTTAQIQNIASFEGFLSSVTPDKLVADTPTVGYGRVVYAGSTFYNGMTKDEAFAYLVKTVNESGYTSNVNKILKENKIKFNQSHFDALVDFSYNLGAYAITNHEELIGTLQDSYGKSEYAGRAFTNVKSAELRASDKDSAALIKTLSPATELTYGKKTNGYYYVTLDDGTTGYIKSGHLTGRNSDATSRNLKNVKLDDFADNFLAYHHASGTCYMGLLYRRVDEVETFFFNDYNANGKQNTFSLSYTCPSNSKTKIG
ncbi:MAG: Ig-like domain-containing protein [Ruminococcus sp.]|nr:Ig-like domain-containing protein [Ruminococcus sp.]